MPALAMIADSVGRKISLKRKGTTESQGFLSGLMPREPETKLAARQWIGAFISIAGVWLLASVSFAISGRILGYVYMTGATFAWVIYSLFTRPLFSRCSRIYIVFWQTAAGFLGFIPFGLAEIGNWGNVNVTVIFHVIFLGVFCSAIGYWCYTRALDTLGISVSAIFINLVPLVTVAFGFFIMHDRLTLLQWLGAAFVVAGVYLATIERKAYYEREKLNEQ
jgi:drug/metabolite transporter (DMT)-like permease